MRHCECCYALSGLDQSRCPRCGVRLLEHVSAVSDVSEEDDAPGNGETEWRSRVRGRNRIRWLEGVLRTAQMALLLGVGVAFLTDWGDLQARFTLPSSRDTASFMATHRASQINDASVALQTALIALDGLREERQGEDAEHFDDEISGWQDGLEGIKAEYKIWGVVDSQHPDAAAEDSLRNAMLYLHSMGHMVRSGTDRQSETDYLRLEEQVMRCLENVRVL